MAINCETALELLSASLDGALTPDQEALLQAHLDQCPGCRALQAELSGLHTACGEMEVCPPAELKERIMANLPPQRSAKVIYWKRWGAMAAAVALVALAAWRLPHSLYDRETVPVTDINVTQRAVSDPEDIPEVGTVVTASIEPDLALPTTHSMGDTAIGLDGDNLPTYESNAPVSLALPSDEVDTFTPSAKRAAPAEAASKELTEADEFLFTSAGGGSAQLQDNAVSPEDLAPQPRIARFSAMPDPVYAIDPDDTDLVAEPDPLGGETPIAALPLETVTQDVRDFSHYSAVLVLAGVDFEGDYPRQRQENGDMWYLLPRTDLDGLPQTLDESGTTYDLRLEGDDLTPDAPYVLLIIRVES